MSWEGYMKKLIICCALTGSLPTKAQNPRLPVTPDEIAADAFDELLDSMEYDELVSEDELN